MKLNQNNILIIILISIVLLYFNTCSTKNNVINNKIILIEKQDSLFKNLNIKYDSLNLKLNRLETEQYELKNFIVLTSDINSKNKEILKLKQKLLKQK